MMMGLPLFSLTPDATLLPAASKRPQVSLRSTYVAPPPHRGLCPHDAARAAPGLHRGRIDMCGLVVMLGLGDRVADAAVLKRMARSIAHRGPDDSGVYLDRQVGFGFRRLSILDLSPAGHQPMSADDGQLVIVFNGEIYNYIELRDELRAAGYSFRSTSDTEVLLAAYRHWGRDCLNRLNGMWAFVIHDRRRGVLFGARDRFGVKPLFAHRGKDYWLLASELKAIGFRHVCARNELAGVGRLPRPRQ